jgi:hypothetical protein
MSAAETGFSPKRFLVQNYPSTVDADSRFHDAGGENSNKYNVTTMDISQLDRGRPSYLREIMEKLENGAPVRDLQRLIALELASILQQRNLLIDALAPNQLNLRKKEVLRSLNHLKHLFTGVRTFSKYINETHKRRDYIDWEGEKFTYVLAELVKLAVDCLRKTGQSEHATQNWLRHYRQQLEDNLEEVCRTAENL